MTRPRYIFCGAQRYIFCGGTGPAVVPLGVDRPQDQPIEVAFSAVYGTRLLAVWVGLHRDLLIWNVFDKTENV